MVTSVPRTKSRRELARNLKALEQRGRAVSRTAFGSSLRSWHATIFSICRDKGLLTIMPYNGAYAVEEDEATEVSRTLLTDPEVAVFRQRLGGDFKIQALSRQTATTYYPTQPLL
jgi:hypothetical protein